MEQKKEYIAAIRISVVIRNKKETMEVLNICGKYYILQSQQSASDFVADIITGEKKGCQVKYNAWSVIKSRSEQP